MIEPRPRRRTPPAGAPRFDARGLLFRWAGQDLTVVEGVDRNTALTVLAEIGADTGKRPSEKHFASWLGLCPQHRGSGGKVETRRLRGGASRAARAFRLAAQGCHHAKNGLGAFCRRVQARAGGGRAVVATARKIACRAYRLLKYGGAYVPQEMAAYEAQFRAKATKGLARKAAELGYKLVPANDGAAPPPRPGPGARGPAVAPPNRRHRWRARPPTPTRWG